MKTKQQKEKIDFRNIASYSFGYDIYLQYFTPVRKLYFELINLQLILYVGRQKERLKQNKKKKNMKIQLTYLIYIASQPAALFHSFFLALPQQQHYTNIHTSHQLHLFFHYGMHWVYIISQGKQTNNVLFLSLRLCSLTSLVVCSL